MNCRHLLIITTFLLLPAAGICGKDKHSRPQPKAQQDQIEVIAHLPLTAGPVSHLIPTQHYRQEYLYAEHEAGKTVTLIDVTGGKQPAVLAEMTFPAGSSQNLVAVTGNAALVSQISSPSTSSAPQSFRILSFADPMHPAVQKEFTGVTALARDDSRGLIFLANSEGIWILQQRYALSPEDEKLRKEIEHSIFDTP